MKISIRELKLLWITLVVLMLGGGYWWVSPRLKVMQERRAEEDQLKRRQQMAEYKINRSTEINNELNVLREKLPRHSMDAHVTAELLKTIEQTATEHGLMLIKRDPGKERNLGDLYEVSITCTWEGDLNALVHFLYAIQSKGIIMDIQLLQVQPKQGQVDVLKGRFTIDCAYIREEPSDNKQENTE